jgi:hypothetical protein
VTELAEWALERAAESGVPAEDFDVDAELAKVRAREATTARMAECELKGIPFEPSPEEQAVLEGIEREREARLSAIPTRAQRDRWEREEAAAALEDTLNRHPPMLSDRRPDEVGRQRMRDEIARLRRG